jgi:hypothetical protein
VLLLTLARPQDMFPNCSRHACNDYPTCSGTQAFCNETAEGVSTWPLCVNGLSKSVARTEATEDLSLHVHNLKPGARRQTLCQALGWTYKVNQRLRLCHF